MPERAENTLFAGIRLSLIFTTVIFVIVHLQGENIIKLFGCEGETVAIGLEYIRYVTIAYFGNAVVFIVSGFATGSGKSIFAMLNACTNMIIARISFVFLFSRVLGLGLTGIFLACGLSQFAGLIPSTIFYLSGAWKKSAIH